MPTPFPRVTLLDWRAQVDKELAGASFDKVLVYPSPEGVPIQPLYTELPAGDLASVDCTGAPFRVCMRHDLGAEGADPAALVQDLRGGAEAVWLRGRHPVASAFDAALASIDLAETFVVLDTEGEPAEATIDRLVRNGATADSTFALAADPFGSLAEGSSNAADHAEDLAALVETSVAAADRFPRATTAMVSTVPYHDAGADGATEIALALSTGVAILEALLGAGLSADVAARRIALRIAVGRDTFIEACKLRALRVTWQKVLAASGAPDAPRTLVHAVCSSRTLTQRDPWVNMLRVTTQVFSAVLGGADLVTPASFDQALGTPSALGRRVARNTGIVLREESHLGRVIDPAGGSYYFETLTDDLARAAWSRFQEIQRQRGIAEALLSGLLRARLAAAWRERLDLVARRKVSILGVSEFANGKEKLPRPPPAEEDSQGEPARRGDAALPAHRDAEAFERLRSRADAVSPPPEAVLVTLGPLAESRPRVGFASGFFGAGGIKARETDRDEPATIACLCGSDERYAAEAVNRARALKAAGCKRLLLAGRPGVLEAPLRQAGVDGFIFVGCDVVAMLSELLEVYA